uniref:Uncharacterized protein n=1 Tax=Phenylobacterium glaciei TaxID=2803784 RepID=A0A974P3L3_9CAUL|nr:hypothetical protein JKL49_26165 [Phenylobacterium glaciei]
MTLIEPYIGPHGVLTGSARIVQEAQEEAAALERLDEVNRRHREFVQRRNAAERQIAETLEALEREEAELLALENVDERKEKVLTASRFAAATRRGRRSDHLPRDTARRRRTRRRVQARAEALRHRIDAALDPGDRQPAPGARERASRQL